MNNNIGIINIVFGTLIGVLIAVIIIIDKKTRVLGGEAEPYTIQAIRKYNGKGFQFHQGEGD